jgi:hypothetical protein
MEGKIVFRRTMRFRVWGLGFGVKDYVAKLFSGFRV